MDQFVKSLLRGEPADRPWAHILFQNALTDAQLGEIQDAAIDRSGYVKDGTRAGDNHVERTGRNHQCREYVTAENASHYPGLAALIETLRKPQSRNAISRMLGDRGNYENSYVRLEILSDTDGFWLEPHCDIPEKLVSCLVFCNFNNESPDLGTDLYDQDLHLAKTIPFVHNTGYMFNHGTKWHGVCAGKTIKVARRGLQINYVTFETDWNVHD